jgi:hypothetical protein
MHRSELIGVLINFAVSLAGLMTFIWLRGEMRDAQIQRPPTIPLFITFATYGGWLVMILTVFFWYWSGMALLGLIYLIFVAPIVMAVIALRLYHDRLVSRYHYGSFVASGVYQVKLQRGRQSHEVQTFRLAQ